MTGIMSGPVLTSLALCIKSQLLKHNKFIMASLLKIPTGYDHWLRLKFPLNPVDYGLFLFERYQLYPTRTSCIMTRNLPYYGLISVTSGNQ